MGFREWIIPQEKRFFQLLESESKMLVESSQQLNYFFSAKNGFEKSEPRLKRIEHECDEIVHDIFNQLGQSFITPLDHEDISSLAVLMDDVVDASFEAVTRARIYGLQKPPVEMKVLSESILVATKEIHEAVSSLSQFDFKTVQKHITRITQEEDESKKILNNALVKLFKQKNPIEIMKTKEIYEDLELAIDKCEDVAFVLGNIVVKHG